MQAAATRFGGTDCVCKSSAVLEGKLIDEIHRQAPERESVIAKEKFGSQIEPVTTRRFRMNLDSRMS